MLTLEQAIAKNRAHHQAVAIIRSAITKVRLTVWDIPQDAYEGTLRTLWNALDHVTTKWSGMER